MRARVGHGIDLHPRRPSASRPRASSARSWLRSVAPAAGRGEHDRNILVADADGEREKRTAAGGGPRAPGIEDRGRTRTSSMVAVVRCENVQAGRERRIDPAPDGCLGPAAAGGEAHQVAPARAPARGRPCPASGGAKRLAMASWKGERPTSGSRPPRRADGGAVGRPRRRAGRASPGGRGEAGAELLGEGGGGPPPRRTPRARGWRRPVCGLAVARVPLILPQPRPGPPPPDHPHHVRLSTSRAAQWAEGLLRALA